MRLKIYFFAFIFSFAVTSLVRGVFFLTSYKLGMSDTQNLILALSSGFTYVIGAQLSQHLSAKFSAKTSMLFLVILQLLFAIICYFAHSFISLCVLFSLFSFANGITWPFAASYASAGLDRKASSSSIGIYNTCWSGAIPLAVWISGWVISKTGTGIFLFVAVFIFVALVNVSFFQQKISHTPEEKNSKESPSEEKINSIEQLLASSRWSMFFSYCLVQLLNSLLPGRFYELGISVAHAGFFACFVDISRVVGFLFMSRTHYWHGSKAILIFCSPILATGFALCMLAKAIPQIIIGELMIGVAAAVSYYASLFYAMHSNDGSVGAGGTHESIIGVGFLAGPITGIIVDKLIYLPLFASIGMPSLSLIILGAISVPFSIFSLIKKDNYT